MLIEIDSLYLFIEQVIGNYVFTIAFADSSEFMGKTFQAAQLTHERFLAIDHSCKILF